MRSGLSTLDLKEERAQLEVSLGFTVKSGPQRKQHQRPLENVVSNSKVIKLRVLAKTRKTHLACERA